MNILIVENEHYLAQSIATKLGEKGYHCEFASTIDEAQRNEKFDAVLLSTNISEHNIYPVIEKYKNTIIILMVSYVNNDTVAKPLKAGASDYILKPFMIEELIRKIEHYRLHKQLSDENKILKNYIDYVFNNITIEVDFKIELPLLIKTNHQRNADFIAYMIAKKRRLVFDFISLAKTPVFDRVKDNFKNKLIYLSDFHTLKHNEKNELCNLIQNKNIIIATSDLNEDLQINTITFKSDSKAYEDNDISSIEDYVKNVILNHQYRLPDTELSRRLGISRKSLWEKRKKYGIVKER
jgi:DNA-binding NtrC family response regulator